MSVKASWTILKKIQDDDIIAVDNIRKAGLGHWLIMPKVGSRRHIRDREALTEEDIPLCKPEASLVSFALRSFINFLSFWEKASNL